MGIIHAQQIRNFVTEKNNTTMKIGDKIPEILGINAEGAEVKASDFAGKKLFLSEGQHSGMYG